MEGLIQFISNLYHVSEYNASLSNMHSEPNPPNVLLSFDIRPVLATLDLYPVKCFALTRYQAENNINPDHAIIIKHGSVTDQKLAAIEAQVMDDFLIHTINSFEHTWIQRDLRHLSNKELSYFGTQTQAQHELFRCIKFQPEYAGMFAHYQRIGDTVFIAVPKY